jgi:hypothetical protein
MTRFLLLLFVFKLAMIPGCNRSHSVDLNTTRQANVYINGTLLNLSNDEINAIIKQTDNVLAGGEGLNNLDVTPELINKIRNNDQYIEINFPQTRFIITDKYGKIEFTRIMIPLTGKLVSKESVTIFYGSSDYTDLPVICSNGYYELRELLMGLEYL